MAASYKRASQHGLLWTVVIFSGIGCSIALSFVFPKDTPWWILLPAFALPIIAMIVVAVILLSMLRRRRVRTIQHALAREDFVVDSKPPSERKREVFAPIAELAQRLDLRTGAEGIRWLAISSTPPSSVCMFEHSFVTGSGKSIREHLHTVIAWLLPGTHASGASVHRPRPMQRRLFTERHGQPPVATGDDRFDRLWLTFGDPAFVRALLNDGVRSMLSSSPKGESWHIGVNWIACAFDGAMDARNIDRFRRRAQHIISRLTPAPASGPA